MVGGLDPNLRYGMDHDLMCRFLVANVPMINIDQTIAGFRIHATSKTSAENINLAIENYQVRMRYWEYIQEKRWKLVLRMKLHLFLRSFKLLLSGRVNDAITTLKYSIWKPIKDR